MQVVHKPLGKEVEVFRVSRLALSITQTWIGELVRYHISRG